MERREEPKGDADLYRQELLTFYVNLSCFLNLMVRDALKNKARLKGKPRISDAVFAAEEFQVRLVCRNKGIRPFLAYMDAPWKHSAYLGRLTKEGKVHMFAYGVKVFFDQLLEEGVKEAFCRDLEGALDLYLGERAAACDESCCASGCAADCSGSSTKRQPGDPACEPASKTLH